MPVLVLPTEEPIHRAHVRSCMLHSDACVKLQADVCRLVIGKRVKSRQGSGRHGERLLLRRWYARNRDLPIDVRGIAL